MATTPKIPPLPKTAPPSTPDEMVRLDNQIQNKEPPKALHSLVSSDSVVILDAGANFTPDKAFKRIEVGRDFSAWSFNPGRKVIHGLPGKANGRLSREEVLTKARQADVKLEPFRPDWSDLVYHPKPSGGNQRKPLRRLKGQRVRPHYVFGNDARQPFYPSGYPWQCIGRMFVWNNPSSPYYQWSGTGVLVDRYTVLTAGHMAPWGANPWMVQFVPAYYNGSSTLGSNVYSYVESYWGYNTNDQVSAWDYVVMKLYDPLGEELGYFGFKTYDDGWNDGNYWTLVGYPGAVAGAEQPSWQGGISFHDDDEDGDAMELETDNGDSSPGDSGGPFFGWWGGAPYVVGVDSGEEEEYQFPFSTQDNNIAAAGNPLTDLIWWGRNNWG
jgi:Trypsin